MVCVKECLYVAGDPLLSSWSGGCVLLIVLAIFLNIYLGGLVGAARRKYQFDYPNMYAVPGMKVRSPNTYEWPGSDQGEPLPEELTITIDEEAAFKFNCVQRAHQNYLEQLPGILAMIVLGTFSFPLFTVIFGSIWLIARFFYATGYAQGPKGRFRGSFQYIGLFGFIGLMIAFAVYLIQGTAPQ
jgi:glutathione S-transferase